MSIPQPGDVENVELARQMIDAFLRGDLEAVFARMTPAVEFENRTGAPGLDGTWVGRDGILDMLVALSEAFEDYRFEPLRYEACDNQVAILLREIGRGRLSGLEVDQRTVFLSTLVDGKVARIEAFPAPRGDLRKVLDVARGASP
jgi:ketosteroid isomerase-like protein